jgi:hypothetical protein
MAVTFHDVLRALIGGQGEKLNDPAWVAEANAAIDHDDPAVTDPDEATEQGPGQDNQTSVSGGIPQFLAPPRG